MNKSSRLYKQTQSQNGKKSNVLRRTQVINERVDILLIFRVKRHVSTSCSFVEQKRVHWQSAKKEMTTVRTVASL